jgi:hypothetical protein
MPIPIRSTDGSVLAEMPRLRDLDAISDDPHPRQTRRIEWIGEQSPLDDPVIVWKLMTGQFTATQAKAIRLAAAKANTRVRRERVFEHEHQYAMAALKGLHRTYHWTKDNDFICDVDYADVDRILGDPWCGHEFRDLDDPAQANLPPLLTGLDLPPGGLVKSSETAFKDADAMANAMLERANIAPLASTRHKPAQRVERVW